MVEKYYEMNERELLIEQIKLQKDINRKVSNMIVIFWWFWGVPFIIALISLYIMAMSK